MTLETELQVMSPMRTAIARRMQASKQEVPHFYLTTEIPMDATLAEVEHLHRAPDRPRVSLSALLVRACALTLREHPSFNAVWTPEGLARAKQINVSVAIALDGGLIAPAILDADLLDVRETAEALSDLVGRARGGKLRGAEIGDGTFTVSNLGMFDISSFTAIVTPPQVAVLATGKVEKRPVWDGDGFVPTSIMSATLSSDHRAVDGADAARFLATLRGLLQEPARLSNPGPDRPSPDR
jgi:pyruvate dehydrogenase E2 component (dihydrolipoamide acetyltransferase)